MVAEVPNIAVDPQETFGVHRRFEAGFDSGVLTFPGHYILYASEGAFRLEVGDVMWLLPPQRAAWVAGGVPFQLLAQRPSVTHSALFAADSLPPLPFASRVFAVSTLARELLLYVSRWGPGRGCEPEDTAQAFFSSLASICRELAATADVFWLPRGRSQELRRVMAFALAQMAEKPSLSDAAKAAHCSPRTLTRRFSEEVGMSWQQFLLRARMIRAMEQLADPNTKVITVAHELGYSSQSAFHQAFRSFCGETPSRYRKRIASSQPLAED